MSFNTLPEIFSIWIIMNMQMKKHVKKKRKRSSLNEKTIPLKKKKVFCCESAWHAVARERKFELFPHRFTLPRVYKSQDRPKWHPQGISSHFLKFQKCRLTNLPIYVCWLQSSKSLFAWLEEILLNKFVAIRLILLG